MAVVLANVTKVFVKFFLAHVGYKLAGGWRGGCLLRGRGYWGAGRRDERQKDDRAKAEGGVHKRHIFQGRYPRIESWIVLFFNRNNFFFGKTQPKQMAHTRGAHSGKSMDPRAASISTLK